MYSVHLPFQSSKVYRLHINTYLPYSQKKISIMLLILDGELLFYFHAEASMHRPSFFFAVMIKDKTTISLTLKILHLQQGSFTCN
jgi:hypothetical protein